MTRPRRSAVAPAILFATAGLWAACNSENGFGTLTGVLSAPDCTFPGGNPKPLGHANPFNAVWRYFLAEPFDSTTPRFPANQLNIRMQNISGGWEFADTLSFWVDDSYEVARCMRGRMNADGTPDWNPDTCDRSPAALGPGGEGRSLVGTERELVHAHFVLQYSCPDAVLASSALGDCQGGTCPALTVCPGRGSWISFAHFGAPPAALATPVGTGFKVNNGDPIDASAYHVELCDEATIEDQQALVSPVTSPAITGTLDGSFSFNLQPNFR
jgi:hypothetical protein